MKKSVYGVTLEIDGKDLRPAVLNMLFDIAQRMIREKNYIKEFFNEDVCGTVCSDGEEFKFGTFHGIIFEALVEDGEEHCAVRFVVYPSGYLSSWNGRWVSTSPGRFTLRREKDSISQARFRNFNMWGDIPETSW